MSAWPARAGAVAAGIGLDQVVPEPPDRFHPVAWFGRAMLHVESHLYGDDRRHGVAHVVAGCGLAVLAGAALRTVIGPAPATAAMTAVAVGARMLGDVAGQVDDALGRGDLEAARRLLPSLVGRDPSELDETGIARAVIESVAENTVDALVAAAFWGSIAGASGVGAYRAVNTMDAMVGHHNPHYERYGWAAARLDDAMNWVPARITAAVVAGLRPRRATAIWRAVRDDAPVHPSPNAGVVEAAFAAALDVQLGGTNRYGERIEHRARLGTGRAATAGDIGAAVELARQVAWVLVALGAVAALAGSAARLLKGD